MRARPTPHPRTVLRTLALALPMAALTVGGTATPGLAGTGHPQASAGVVTDVGLFGAQDPTYDGVYRDALSLIALEADGVQPDETARDWFAGQQCDDGAFTSYRTDTSTACAAKDEDSNATGLAIQAQSLVDIPTADAVAALERFQDADGGFYSNKLFSADPGSDANSTGIALSALSSVGIDPSTVTSNGKTGFDFLTADQVDCLGAVADRGAYDYQIESPLSANAYATSQAALGVVGDFLPVQPQSGTTDQPSLECTTPPDPGIPAGQSGPLAAGYLARTLAANDGLIPNAFGGGADYTSTANAVIALVSAGVGADQVTQALDALEAHVDDYVVDSDGNDRPAALAELILAAHAGGRDPRTFGAHLTTGRMARAVRQDNLVGRLLATERRPAPVPVAGGAGGGGTTGGGTTGGGTGNTEHHKSVQSTALPATGARELLLLALAGLVAVAAGAALTVAGRRS